MKNTHQFKYIAPILIHDIALHLKTSDYDESQIDYILREAKKQVLSKNTSPLFTAH